MPGFHAILVLRDEADIIAQTLEHLLSWCDTLFIYDTGSLDNTWEIVTDFASRDRRIVLIGKESVLFVNGLRAWVFNQHRDRFRKGDWIARVDADEFYHIPPPQFIRERLARGEGRIYAALYDFVITASELESWRQGRETLADRAQPIADRRRFYRCDDYPELRLFRYRRTMRWFVDGYDPCSGGLVAAQRIPVRHYRARDPVQLQTRCAIRAATAQATGAAEVHWHFADWRREVCNEQDPALFHWAPGEPLPERIIRNHLTPKFPRPGSERAFRIESAIRQISPALPRLAQHVLYRSGLVYLRDHLRPRIPDNFRPTPLPSEVAERIRRYLAVIEEHPNLSETPLPVRDGVAQAASR